MTTTASRETAFHPRLAALTDQWMDLFGYLAPSVVTTTADEYRACREAAALMDFSMLRKVDIEGPGAVEMMNATVTRDLSRVPQGRIAYGALTRRARQDDRRLHVHDPLARCGAVLRRQRSRLRAVLGARGRLGDHGVGDDRRAAAPLPAGAREPPDPGATHRRRHLGRRIPVLHVPRGSRDRGHPGLRDPARVHRRARVRAVGRASPLPRAVGRADRRRRAVGDARDRDGRARPVPDRRRVHHRRGGVRPRRVAVRVRPGVVGRLRQADVAGARRRSSGIATRPGSGSPAWSSSRVAPMPPARPSRSTAPTSASSRRPSSRRTSTAPRSASRRSTGTPRSPDTLVEARFGGAAVPGRIVRHPVYDPERRRAKEA